MAKVKVLCELGTAIIPPSQLLPKRKIYPLSKNFVIQVEISFLWPIYFKYSNQPWLLKNTNWYTICLFLSFKEQRKIIACAPASWFIYFFFLPIMVMVLGVRRVLGQSTTDGLREYYRKKAFFFWYLWLLREVCKNSPGRHAVNSIVKFYHF